MNNSWTRIKSDGRLFTCSREMNCRKQLTLQGIKCTGKRLRNNTGSSGSHHKYLSNTKLCPEIEPASVDSNCTDHCLMPPERRVAHLIHLEMS